jgi:hypothetical protein
VTGPAPAPAPGTGTGTGAAIRWSTIAAVATVAGIAGWASYEHPYAVVSAHGVHGLVARVYPGTIDGLLYAASMVLLDSARRSVPAPGLARAMLGTGIAATLFANVLAGVQYGPLGAVVAAWPALALVGSYELLMWLIRSGTAPAPAAEPARKRARKTRDRRTPAVTPQDAEQHFAPQLAAGTVPSLRTVRSQLHVGTNRARELHQHLAGVNGSAPA